MPEFLDDQQFAASVLLPIGPLAALRALSEQEFIACSDGVQLETLRELGV